MNRFQIVRGYVNGVFDTVPDANQRRTGYIHSYGVSQLMVLVAGKRSLNTELAAVIGLLHDIYRYKTGVTDLHWLNGAEMVRVAFKNELAGLFCEEEQTLIKSAIYHHADKTHKHDEYDECLKDCDVLQHFLLSGIVFSPRLGRVAAELGIPVPDMVQSNENLVNGPFRHSDVAEIAEQLAAKGIVGERSNTDYMEIIKYFPEQSAFDELKNGWCAAFVYHCCIQAGLELPLCSPHTAQERSLRFACVLAWYEWAKKRGYCYYEKDGYQPRRGDIIIYNNIIPQEAKSPNSAWCDHMGIVLSSDNEHVVAAEGNVNHQNVSGIVSRRRDNKIGCYIRIPEDYVYIDWMLDYKTGKIRVEEG